ncbi:RNA methyltransferase, RsmD family [Bacteriovorax sp. BSW11_IV]|uniref:RsmD family RNA methyltransferase n=1 Tax=Bacteriovorax sp. BSW11_IV TaxID=1353529 RepID=UPI00038A0A8C|nr:RsmD family RNA methyltransferase [Bacteriovorax sp. BSW11_IV]EQC48156.1 RNA methyltransferase, RsmD family [Bacteriovorax sp. BSW11_IV]
MSIKILGGKAKGLSLEVPKGDAVRPTSVMLRRKLFDAHQNWKGIHFIDVCAGTGAVSAEALSRGANSVICIEGDKKVAQILKRNFQGLEKSGIDTEKVLIVIQKAEKWISHFEAQYSHYTIERKESCVLFFDPPYEVRSLYEAIAKELFEKDWFKGQVWIESDDQKGVKESELFSLTNKEFKKLYRQGTSFVAIYDCREHS